MEDKNLTQIQITKCNWKELNKFKDSPDQTFDDVISMLIKSYYLTNIKNGNI